MRELKGDVLELKTDVSGLKGDVLEMKLDRRIRPLLSQRLGLRRSQIVQSPVSDTSPELYNQAEQALDNGIITGVQEIRISATDIILRAQRKADHSLVWVAVEVSNDIGQHDIERARQSADALSRVFCQDTMAVVAGYRIRALDQERATESDVHILLIPEDG